MTLGVFERIAHMRRTRSLGWDALRIYALQFAILGFGLFSGVVVARVLGPTGKGVVDLFQLLNTFLVELGLVGFNSGLLYYLANRGRPLAEVHGTGLLFSGIAGGLTALIAWLTSAAWLPLFTGLPKWALFLALGLVPVALYRSIWHNLMTGINRAVVSYWLGLAVAATAFGLTVTLWLADRLTAGTAIGVVGAITVLASVAGYVMLVEKGVKLRPSIGLGRQSLRFGFVIYIGLLANLLHFKIDQVMINRLIGTGAVGVYAVSVRWAETLFLLDSALIASALHRISSGTAAESYSLTGRVMWRQLQISSLAGLVLAAAAYPLVVGLYGDEYRGAVVPLVLLVPGVISWSLAKVLSQHLVYQRGIRWLPAVYAVAGMVTNIVLNVLLIPRWGIVGAALASMMSYGLMLTLTGLTFWQFRRQAASGWSG